MNNSFTLLNILTCRQLFSNVEEDIIKKVNSLVGPSNPTDTGIDDFNIVGRRYNFKAGFVTVVTENGDYFETTEKSKAMISVEELVYLKSSQTFKFFNSYHLIHIISTY